MILAAQVWQALPDDEELRATNGKTLDLLLQPQNSQLEPLPPCAGGSERSLVVKKCRDLGAYALVDAGGTMAGVDNLEVAMSLLEEVVKAKESEGRFQGVTFFNTRGWRSRWEVLDMDGVSRSKDASPIRECDTFAFFDDSRCRGADLKLRREAVAVITVSRRFANSWVPRARLHARLRSWADSAVWTAGGFQDWKGQANAGGVAVEATRGRSEAHLCRDQRRLRAGKDLKGSGPGKTLHPKPSTLSPKP